RHAGRRTPQARAPCRGQQESQRAVQPPRSAGQRPRGDGAVRAARPACAFSGARGAFSCPNRRGERGANGTLARAPRRLVFSAEFVIHLHEECNGDVSSFEKKLEDSGGEFPASFVENLDRLIKTLKPKASLTKVDGGPNGASGAPYRDNDKLEERALKFPSLALPDKEFHGLLPDVLADEEERLTLGKRADGDRGARNARGDDGEVMAQLENMIREKKLESIREEEGEEREEKRRRSRDRGRRRRSGSRSRSRSPARYRPADGARDRWRGNGYDHERRGDSDRYGRGRHSRDEDDRWGRHSGGADRRHGDGGGGRPKDDDVPVLYKIYDGTISGMRDFGAFVSLQGVRGRVEGM
ncbi:MAG: hypothetical protein BJ554DRAFT_4776, partial [Olpidium bornovanus]